MKKMFTRFNRFHVIAYYYFCGARKVIHLVQHRQRYYKVGAYTVTTDECILCILIRVLARFRSGRVGVVIINMFFV